MWNLKYDINEFIYETETDSHRIRLVVAKASRRRGGGWIGS